MADVQELVEQISEMTVLELSELVKAIEDKFGVSAAAPVMAAGMMPMGAAAGADGGVEGAVRAAAARGGRGDGGDAAGGWVRCGNVRKSI